MGSPSPFSYLAAVLGLNSLVFAVFALVPYFKPFRERLAGWAVGFTALGALLGFIDQAGSYLGEEGHERWPIVLSAAFSSMLVVITAFLLLCARKRAEAAATQQKHGDSDQDINN